MDKPTIETPAVPITVQVATLQIRGEGPILVAYIALDGKVDERHQVATISRAACNAAGGSQGPLFRAFEHMPSVQDWLTDWPEALDGLSPHQPVEDMLRAYYNRWYILKDGDAADVIAAGAALTTARRLVGERLARIADPRLHADFIARVPLIRELQS